MTEYLGSVSTERTDASNIGFFFFFFFFRDSLQVKKNSERPGKLRQNNEKQENKLPESKNWKSDKTNLLQTGFETQKGFAG